MPSMSGLDPKGKGHPVRGCPVEFMEPCKKCLKKHVHGLCEMETDVILGLVINTASTHSNKALLCAKMGGVRGGGEVAALYDGRANVSIVARGWVDKMGLRAVGESTLREVQLALGGNMEVTTQMFEIPLIDKEGDVHMVRATIDNNAESWAATERKFGLAQGSVGRAGRVAQLLLAVDNTNYMPVMVWEEKNI